MLLSVKLLIVCCVLCVVDARVSILFGVWFLLLVVCYLLVCGLVVACCLLFPVCVAVCWCELWVICFFFAGACCCCMLLIDVVVAGCLLCVACVWCALFAACYMLMLWVVNCC